MAGREDFHCGSEEVFTHECVVCKDDENVVRKAEGYCMECKEFLCAKCILYHRSVRLTKSHTIKDVDDDIEDIIGQFSGTTIEEDVCQEHSRTRIDMFCRDHNEVGCHLCMTLIHSKCNKEPIASAVLAFDDSKLENEMKELRCVSNGLRQTQDANESIGKQAIKAYNSFIESQRLQRKQILQTIRASQAVDERVKVGVINSVLAECKQKNKMVEDGTKYANTLLQRSSEINLSNNAEQKFITWNKLKKQVGLLQNTMEDSVVGNKYMFDNSMVAEGICVYKTVESDASSVSDFYAVLNKDVKLPMGKVIFEPLRGQDTMVKNGVAQIISTKHQCITAMKLYENKSMEELRYEWYHEFGVLNKGRIGDIKMDLVTTPEKDPYKLLLLGDWNAGKTTFIRRSISGNISKVYKDSMGVYVHPITLSTSAGEITFDVWDTCGQERFGPLRDGIFEKAKCAIIMFDVSSPTSVNSVRRWYKIINERCGQIPFMVCGNRVDKAKKEIKSSNVGKLRKLKIPCISYQLISGKTIENFEAPFLMIARALLSNNSMTVTTKCVLYPPVDFKRTDTAIKGPSNNHQEDQEDL